MESPQIMPRRLSREIDGVDLVAPECTNIRSQTDVEQEDPRGDSDRDE